MQHNATHCKTLQNTIRVDIRTLLKRGLKGLYKEPAETRLLSRNGEDTHVECVLLNVYLRSATLSRNSEDTHVLLYLMFEKALLRRVYVEYGI